jgi:hypothetical protein
VFLVRYFFYAGSALLTLLLLVDWYSLAAPATVAGDDQMRQTSLDKEILRIQSSQKWPQKIVFDTNLPTIVPPSALVANASSPPPPFKAAEANNSVLNAHAEAKPGAKVQTSTRRVPRHRTSKPAPQFGAYPVASAWTPWW